MNCTPSFPGFRQSLGMDRVPELSGFLAKSLIETGEALAGSILINHSQTSLYGVPRSVVGIEIQITPEWIAGPRCNTRQL